MTVHATGQVERLGTRAGTPAASRASATTPRHEDHHQAMEPTSFVPIQLWVVHDVLGREAVRWENWQMPWAWSDGAGWLDAMTTTTWTAGPFEYPVEVEPPSSHAWRGQSIVYRVGNVTHVIQGPWQVVIRNLGAHSERAIVSRWQIARSWTTGGGRETRAHGVRVPVHVGASERMALGASKRVWLSGSEVRLGGASERWKLGASEMRLGGASERRLLGASEFRLAGASARRLGGASERLAGSEMRLGSSEGRLYGVVRWE